MPSRFETKKIIDCHTHAGAPDVANRERNFFPWVQSVAELEEKLAEAGVWGAAVFPFPNTTFYEPSAYNLDKSLVVSGRQPFPYADENQVLLDQAEGKSNIFPFACIDPNFETEAQLTYLSSLMKGKPKIFGLKLHGYAVQGNAMQLAETGFADFAVAHNIPITFHSGSDQHSLPEHALNLAKLYPKLRVNLAHLATFKESVLDEIKDYPNVFTDCCPLTYLNDMAKEDSRWVNKPNHIVIDRPELTLIQYYQKLQDQLLWGTDEPWTKMITPDGIVRSDHSLAEEAEVLSTLESLLPVAVKSIAHDNTLRFLFG